MYAAVLNSRTCMQLPCLFFCFVLDMPYPVYLLRLSLRADPGFHWLGVQCVTCEVWSEIMTSRTLHDQRWDPYYCGNCWRWWYEMHDEVWWPATRAYIVMLARCSVQDNPDAVL